MKKALTCLALLFFAVMFSSCGTQKSAIVKAENNPVILGNAHQEILLDGLEIKIEEIINGYKAEWVFKDISGEMKLSIPFIITKEAILTFEICYFYKPNLEKSFGGKDEAHYITKLDENDYHNVLISHEISQNSPKRISRKAEPFLNFIEESMKLSRRGESLKSRSPEIIRFAQSLIFEYEKSINKKEEIQKLEKNIPPEVIKEKEEKIEYEDEKTNPL